MKNPKHLKIVALYYGPRRPSNNNANSPESLMYLFKEMIRFEMIIDPGVDTDLLIVRNESPWEIEPFLQHYEGKRTLTGRIKVMRRPNIGGSFGAFTMGFNLFSQGYDYVSFFEDDVHMIRPGWATEMVKVLEDPKVGYACVCPIPMEPEPHTGGGTGMSRKSTLDKIADINGGFLSTPYGNKYHEMESQEVNFTAQFVRAGYTLQNIPGLSPLPDNWEQHPCMTTKYRHLLKSDDKFCYRVGLKPTLQTMEG